MFCFYVILITDLPVSAMLKELGPSAVDAELRSLGPEGGGSVELMYNFLTFINEMLKTNKDFELIQAYLGLFLKVRRLK
jgi:U3 small nucleolar RNA-associated protein 21